MKIKVSKKQSFKKEGKEKEKGKNTYTKITWQEIFSFPIKLKLHPI